MGDLTMVWIGIVAILALAAYSAIVTKIAVDFYQDYCKLEKKFHETRMELHREQGNTDWLRACLSGARERGNAMEDKSDTLGKQLRESQERVELLEGALGAIEQMSSEATSLLADRANVERNERDDDGEAKV
jgi:hypothetical protein